MIAIPKKYRLVNNEWTTKWDGLAEDTDGITEFDTATTRLRSGQRRSYTHHVFYHELQHQMLEAVGRPDLSADEGLVDALAGVLHQFLQTKRGNLEKP